MRILVVGAMGTLGRAIVAELSPRHEIVRAGRKGPDAVVDITSAASVDKMYQSVGRLDAVVCAAGTVPFAGLGEITEAQYQAGLDDKLMGQVRLVLAGQTRVSDGGSFTLISGVLGSEPIRAGSSASMVNGAIDAFVRAAAIELPRGLRINSVSPTVFAESMGGYAPFFRGFAAVPAAHAALAFSKSVEGAHTGRTYLVV
jgi:NAD(P)-dependent dehydrogenase (short-subunit alcohol dehydrogenase family)